LRDILFEMVFQIWWLTLEGHIQLHIKKMAVDTYPDTLDSNFLTDGQLLL
jgi:hypothetical protein